MAKYQTSVNNILRNQPVTAPGSGTAYTILGTDKFIDLTPTAAFALTLPAPSASNVGQTYTLKDVTGVAATFNITVTPASGLIDGAASFVMATNFESLSVYSDGSNYFISSQEGAPVLMPWTNVATATQTASGNNGYSISNVAACTVTLPVGVFGQVVQVVSAAANTGGWILKANGAGTIQFGTAVSTATTGSIASSSATGGDMIFVLAQSATAWVVIGSNGNLLVT